MPFISQIRGLHRVVRRRRPGRFPGAVAPLVALAVAWAALDASPVRAQTLEEALALAYTTNPNLRAARASLRAVDEGVTQARGGWRPNVSSTLTVGYTDVESDNNTSNSSSDGSSVPKTANLSITQPVYTGGAVSASIRRAEAQVQSQRAQMFTTEQSTLLEGATAYVDVIRDESVLQLQINNLQRLQKQLEATRDRFRVGEVTRTDVSQAEARVARARADRTQAEGNLISSRVIFERVIGIVPQELTQPAQPVELPDTREAAVDEATVRNFQLTQAKYAERSAIEQIDVSRADLLPSLDIVGEASHAQDTGGGDNESTSFSIEAQLSIPIYQQGIVYSRVRAAKEEAHRQRLVVEATRRNVVDTAARAFEAWQTAIARTVSLQSEVQSAQVALEGVEQEATVGARTVLDVLDAEQELLDAQVTLVRAQRDAFVASQQLLSALGRLTAQELGLPVQIYDYDTHYRETERRRFGSGITEPLP